MFFKQGSAVALMQTTTVDQWNIQKNAFQPSTDETRDIVATVDNSCIYLHGTILASVDIEPNHQFHIKKATEDFINDNGDAFPRDEVLNRYQTFKTHSRTYSEHKQGPEFAKGRCIDVVVRNMGDTVLVDVLFTVDKKHEDIVHNIESKLVTHLSMGCQTEFTKCSICGNLAHNEDEYCNHIKTQKRQIIQASDGTMRKVAELCYNNTWIDISLVMNPAFGGAAIRKIVSSDNQGKQVLAYQMENNPTYENAILKAASRIATHPLLNTTTNQYPTNGYQDITWENRHDIKDDFDKDNPNNESRVEGPISDLHDVSNGFSCCKCSKQTAHLKLQNNHSILKCSSCNYIQEVENFSITGSVGTYVYANGNVGLGTSNPQHHIAVETKPSTTPPEDDMKLVSPENLYPDKGDIQINPTSSKLILEHTSCGARNIGESLEQRVANLEKLATRKQVLDIVADLIKNVNMKLVNLEEIEKAANNHQFLKKEIIDTLTNRGFKIASKNNFRLAINDIINYLYSYTSQDDLNKVASIMDDFNIDNTQIKQAIQHYQNVDESEKLIQATLLNVEKLACNEDNVRAGVTLYMEKVYDKWDHKDISELIRNSYPDEAIYILDEVRKLHFR